MDYNRLRKILIRSNLMAACLSLVVAVIGVTILLTPIFRDKGSIVIGLLFGGVIASLGFVGAYRLIPKMIQAYFHKHALLVAIEQKEKDFLVWLFVKEIHVSDKNTGDVYGTSDTLIYFDKYCQGKGVELAVSKKDNVQELFDYLSNQFEIPYLGYTIENRDAINEKFQLTGLRKIQ